MADTIIITRRSELPFSKPDKIVIGDDWCGHAVHFRKADDVDGNPQYVDTTGWSITAGLYDSQAVGAALLAVVTVATPGAPKYGYETSLTAAETALLSPGVAWLKVTTDSGACVRTYEVSPVEITGVG